MMRKERERKKERKNERKREKDKERKKNTISIVQTEKPDAHCTVITNKEAYHFGDGGEAFPAFRLARVIGANIADATNGGNVTNQTRQQQQNA